MEEFNLQEYLLTTPSNQRWKKIGTQKRAGILVPLFSVYSRRSGAFGDFDDLKLLVDWGVLTGNTLIQLLPMNETGVLFCPYDSVSSFALEPAYLSVKSFASSIKPGAMHVDWQLKEEKLRALKDVFLGQDSFFENPAVQQFISRNSYWLDDFALYKVIKRRQGNKPWYEWEEKFKNRDALALKAFRQEHDQEIYFELWLQWLCFNQLREARSYANLKGVWLKGDLPILVSRDSADVWQHPQYFKLDFAAGAPPDMYCAKGQRWGMPPYNWEPLAKDGFRYIKERLRYAENFYDILRIDHVVGLFRIWSIPYNEPLENQGLNGAFDPPDEALWRNHGINNLMLLLTNTSMLLCAEDLGVIPKACTEALKNLGIPGSDVQRWAKEWKERHDFLDAHEYRPVGVSMLSTHDTTNWMAWWDYEAGTVDEQLFVRKCTERGIDYHKVKDHLFDPAHSHHGRLRWLESVESVDKLLSFLGKPKEQVKDFIELYENSYHEKQKLWKQLGFSGLVREKADAEILRRAMQTVLFAESAFCVNTMIDWLCLGNIFKGDPYQYRINTPGTISAQNWSLRLPISLDDLLRHKVNKDIRKLISASGRII